MFASALWGLPVVDVVVIVIFFAVTFYIGLRPAKHVRNQEDYFLAGRRFGKLIQTFAMFGQATSADSAVGQTTMVGANGAAGMWAGLLSGLLYMPLLWLTAPWYRRLRVLTLADFFTERYESKRMAMVYAALMAVFFVIVSAVGYVALSKTCAAIMVKPAAALTADETAERGRGEERQTLERQDYRLLTPAQQARLDVLRKEKPQLEFSYVNPATLMSIIALSVLIYVVIGGLEAAFLADLIQGMMIIVLTVMLIPFAIVKINALHGTTGFLGPFTVMHRQLPEWYFELLGSPKLIEFNWYWILAFGVVGALNIGVQANQLTALGSAKDDHTARMGGLTGIFIKRYCTVIWGLVAMFTLVLYGTNVADPDFLWGRVTRDLLGPAGFGLVGLMIACLMAALMSTASALALTTSAMLTENVYRPLFPERSEHHYVVMGRILSAVYVFGGLVVALYFNSVFGLLKVLVLFNAIIAAAFWMGMVWRRANRQAAWVSIGVTGLFTLALPLLLPLVPGICEHSRLLKESAQVAMTRTYQASAIDVAERTAAITRWRDLQAQGLAEGELPVPLREGEQFTKTFTLPRMSVFWSQGIDRSGKQPRGQGMLKVELVALDLLGLDLSKFSYSLNETLAVSSRLFVPFGVFILVALLTKPHDKKLLDRFYVKLLTPTLPDHAADAREMELSYAQPDRFKSHKLFPNSSWEFRRWDKDDWFGMGLCSLAAAGVIVLLVLIVTLGKS